ncbi:hypothetical protein ACOKS3_17335 [Pseudomonas sp. HS6-2]|uniref:hypothetical protein n=1 Tax=Pseudomonas sp. HS6-2 TaxID=3410986 RepID=UPI003BCEF9E0
MAGWTTQVIAVALNDWIIPGNAVHNFDWEERCAIFRTLNGSSSFSSTFKEITVRRILMAGLLAASSAVSAETMLVAPSGSLCAGQTVTRDSFFKFLSTTQKCDLPIVNAEHMRSFRDATPKNAIVKMAEGKGCWGKTLGGDAIFIYDDGKTSTMPMAVFAEVDFDYSGKGKVISSVSQQKGWTKCH